MIAGIKPIWQASFTLALVLAAPAVLADGEFYQLDLGAETRTAVVSVERERLSYGIVFSDYPGATDLNLTASYKLPLVTPVTFRAGPAIQLERLDRFKAGIRLVAEYYWPTTFGSVFLLGEATTIDQGYFALMAIGFDNPALTFEFSSLGDNDGFRDSVAAVAFGIPNASASFRLGYKFNTAESFLGVSINTF